MSNYLTQEYKPQAPQSNVDVGLIDKTLGAMEGQYNANKAAIDQTLALYTTQLKGLRESDTAYASAKLMEVTSAINQNSSRNANLAYNYNRDSILKAITSVVDDPIISDMIVSTQNYKGLDAQYQAVLKKDPKSASKINYQDALDLGGFDAYMKGETKKLGSMEYVPYTNVQKELNDSVAKWAKENGYHTAVNVVNKGLYFEKTKGEYLTKDEILNFINVNVDPNMQRQMNINARQSYGKLPENEFNQIAQRRYQVDVDRDSKSLVEENAKLKTVHGEDEVIVRRNIGNLEKNIETKKENIRTNTYDRNSQYEFYKQDLYNGLAEAYDKADITDISYDDTPLDIAKFGFEQEQFKINTALKEREIQLKEYELDQKNSKGQLLGAGTAIPVIPEEGAEPKPAEDLLRENFVSTEAQLKGVLQAEDPEYKKLTSLEDRNNYVRQLMKDGGKINPNSNSPLTTDIANAIIAHKNNYKVYGEYVNGIKASVEPLVADQYNDMLKAKNLNLNNLSSSMPFTSSLLKSKKSFENLDRRDQEIVRYERVLNQLQFDDSLSNSERKGLKTYLAQVNKRNINDKFFQNNIKSLGTPDEVGGATKNFWTNVVYGTGIKGSLNVLGMAKNLIGYGYDTIAGNNAEENWKQNNIASTQGMQEVGRNWKTFKQSLLDNGIPFQDTNITEIDTGEDTGSGRDLSKSLRDNLATPLKKSIDTINAFRSNLEDKQSFSFSTENKGQKPIAELLGQVIQKQTGETPLQTENNYNLEYFADTKEFKISYLDEDKKVETKMLSEALMPNAIRGMYRTSAGNWSTDVKNKNATLPSVSINKPSTNEEAWKMVSNLSTISGDNFNAIEQEDLRNTILMTPEEQVINLEKRFPKLEKNPQAIEELNNALNTKVEIESRVIQNVGFKMYPVITVGGERKALDTSAHNLYKIIPEYEPDIHLKRQLLMVKDTYDLMIKKIIKKYDLQ